MSNRFILLPPVIFLFPALLVLWLHLQELCVSIIPTFADMVDYTSMKHSIIPRLTALCTSTPSVGVSEIKGRRKE